MKFEIVAEKDLPVRTGGDGPYSQIKERVWKLALGEILKVDPEGYDMRFVKSNVYSWGSQMKLKIRMRSGKDGCLYIWKEYPSVGE